MHLLAKLVSSSWKLAMTSNALPTFDALSVRRKSTLLTRLLVNRVFSYSSTILTPVWDPLNASNDSKKAFASQPEKVCTVIATKECIYGDPSKYLKLQKHDEEQLKLSAFVQFWRQKHLVWGWACWDDDVKGWRVEFRIHRSTKSLFSCQKTRPRPSFKTQSVKKSISTAQLSTRLKSDKKPSYCWDSQPFVAIFRT